MPVLSPRPGTGLQVMLLLVLRLVLFLGCSGAWFCLPRWSTAMERQKGARSSLFPVVVGGTDTHVPCQGNTAGSIKRVADYNYTGRYRSFNGRFSLTFLLAQRLVGKPPIFPVPAAGGYPVPAAAAPPVPPAMALEVPRHPRACSAPRHRSTGGEEGVLGRGPVVSTGDNPPVARGDGQGGWPHCLLTKGRWQHLPQHPTMPKG